MGYRVYLKLVISVCWVFITRLQSGPVTTDLTTVVPSYKFLINDVKPIHSLIRTYVYCIGIARHVTQM